MLRKLMEKDAEKMLEWMHDPDINCYFRFDANDMNMERTIEFIIKSNESKTDRHYAIVNEDDEYLGTVSLKNIDYKNKKAEYAISTRKKAHGTGVAYEATKEIIRIAFEELNLNRLYLNVLSINERAIKFYEKVGFIFEGESKQDIYIRGNFYNLKWFGITNLDRMGEI